MAEQDFETSFAMLTELLNIGIPLEELCRYNKIELEFEHIQMSLGDHATFESFYG